jgi:hypothetical protein
MAEISIQKLRSNLYSERDENARKQPGARLRAAAEGLSKEKNRPAIFYP